MDFTEYWAIVERGHTIQNPTSPEKLMRLADDCGVGDGQRILDVGSGKGWLLCRWAQQWRVEGTGLEINPWFVAEARERATAEGVAERVSFIEGPALDFQPVSAAYDVVLCVGASFALGDFDRAVPWMRRAMKPEGVLAIGEPFLNESPLPAAVQESAPSWASSVRGLHATVEALESHALELIGLIVASPDDWDRYYSPHWSAARAWAREHPEHPEREELLRQARQERDSYLRWDRRNLGWGIFVARAA